MLQNGQRRQKIGLEGHGAGAPPRRPPGTPHWGNGPEPVATGWIQLGEPEKIRSPADVHGPQQLLLGDQIRRDCAQNHNQEFIQ